jgi:flagellar export protein FliJ
VKPFRFRAETVLELRRREEDTARTALTQARAAVERARGRVALARSAVADAGRAFEDAMDAGSAASLLAWHRTWIVRLRTEVLDAMRIAAVADQAAGAAAAALGRAMQRRRALERLRERAWRRYCLARDRAEALEMDQLAAVRFAHQALAAGGSRDDYAYHFAAQHVGTDAPDGQGRPAGAQRVSEPARDPAAAPGPDAAAGRR